MDDSTPDRLERFPATRLSTIDICELGRRRHHLPGLLEIDVTAARERFREIKARDGAGLSFTAWLAKCIATAAGEYPEAAGYLYGRRRRLVPGSIDVSITVERQVGGQRVPLPYVLRDAAHKSVRALHDEIRAAQHAGGDDTVVIGRQYGQRSMAFFFGLPGAVRRWIWRAVLLRPRTARRTMGNVMVTSVGMFGAVDGWLIPISVHPLTFAVGAVIKKPGVIVDESGADAIAVREFLKLTVLVDHDVIDGAPAARMIARLDELLRGAYGLEEA
jgi:pyruvate/2-oxoglutarate dehydrogenase complex dihydrolipoamide acyltransferase (E2) component